MFDCLTLYQITTRLSPRYNALLIYSRFDMGPVRTESVHKMNVVASHKFVPIDSIFRNEVKQLRHVVLLRGAGVGHPLGRTFPCIELPVVQLACQ